MNRLTNALLTALYALFRGECRVETTLEPTVYRFAQAFDDGSSKGTLYNIVCQRLQHTVTFKRWYMPTRIYRTYKVMALDINGQLALRWPIAHYPELSPRFMGNTNVPYFLAIHAYVEGVVFGKEGIPAP